MPFLVAEPRLSGGEAQEQQHLGPVHLRAEYAVRGRTCREGVLVVLEVGRCLPLVCPLPAVARQEVLGRPSGDAGRSQKITKKVAAGPRCCADQIRRVYGCAPGSTAGRSRRLRHPDRRGLRARLAQHRDRLGHRLRGHPDPRQRLDLDRARLDRGLRLRLGLDRARLNRGLQGRVHRDRVVRDRVVRVRGDQVRQWRRARIRRDPVVRPE
jgi:hypothetical protein